MNLRNKTKENDMISPSSQSWNWPLIQCSCYAPLFCCSTKFVPPFSVRDLNHLCTPLWTYIYITGRPFVHPQVKEFSRKDFRGSNLRLPADHVQGRDCWDDSGDVNLQTHVSEITFTPQVFWEGLEGLKGTIVQMGTAKDCEFSPDVPTFHCLAILGYTSMTLIWWNSVQPRHIMPRLSEADTVLPSGWQARPLGRL